MDFSPLIKAILHTKLEALLPLLKESALNEIRHGDFLKWQVFLSQIPKIRPSSSKFSDVIRIGELGDIDEAARRELRIILEEIIPWRKGPFEIFGIKIDSEWQSQLKWQRLQNYIEPLKGRKVLDVGSGNGYYGFRMLEDNADLVVGLDPHIPYVTQFWTLKSFLPDLPIFVMPYRLDQISEKVTGFDTVFSMGVIYHRRSPIDHLLQLKRSLSPGGELVLETLFVEGPTGYSFTPERKYARMSNVWFIPSIGTIEKWLLRCGYKNIRVLDKSYTKKTEQRKTEWMPFESLADGLAQKNISQTIEGSPAPARAIILASSEV